MISTVTQQIFFYFDISNMNGSLISCKYYQLTSLKEVYLVKLFFSLFFSYKYIKKHNTLFKLEGTTSLFEYAQYLFFLSAN